MNGEYDFNREVSDKYSLRGRVFHKIRNDILNGRYKEHEELKEIRIGKELGVSRTPVREALRQLELEGLVQIIPNRGAFVTGIQENDVRDIYANSARAGRQRGSRRNSSRPWKKTSIWPSFTRAKDTWSRWRSWTTSFTTSFMTHAVPRCWSIS